MSASGAKPSYFIITAAFTRGKPGLRCAAGDFDHVDRLQLGVADLDADTLIIDRAD